jgi:AraC-like DNA-binding protein
LLSPNWSIGSCRLRELIEKIHSGQELDWAQVALDLGYADQAHMANDFKSIVGYTPTDYRKQAPSLDSG